VYVETINTGTQQYSKPTARGQKGHNARFCQTEVLRPMQLKYI